jgi:hypothetical protein
MARSAAVTLAVVVLAGGAAGQAAEVPDLSGIWRLDPKRSDDMRARIDKAAGPAQVTGGGASGFTILPELNTRSEVERVELREWMLRVAEQAERLEIQQTPDQLKVYAGDDAVRIFYFGREHMREDNLGRRIKCRVRVEGERLVMEEEWDKGMKMWEAFTPVPQNDWLIHALRFESRLLKSPLELRLFYVKAKE